ncbi:MAG: MFS transporter [Dehalococcoidia bacterium]
MTAPLRARAATPAVSATVAATRRAGWLLVVALGIGVFVGGFDQTFVVPVLARMLADLDIPINEFGRASWIINGYLLGYTVAMPLMGRVADVYGRLRVFLLGLLIFAAGSVLVALAPNLLTLALARAVTALGGGALVPVALAIAADTLPRHQRPLGLSSISVLDDASTLVGPLWGTLIGVWIGWRGLFWMNIVLAVPVLIAVLAAARRADDGRLGAATTQSRRVDWPGGALMAAALAALTFALADDGQPRTAVMTLALFGAAAALLALFVAHERRAGDPLIDLGMFRNRRLVVALLLFLLEGGALITALVNVPLMTEVLWDGRGAEPGLMLMRMVLFMIVGGVLGGVLAPLAGYRITAVTGFALAAAGLYGMYAWPATPSEGARWLALAVAGLGFTLSDAPIYATVMNAVASERRASAAALLQVLQTTGMIVGMALLASQGLGRFNQRAAELFRQSAFGDAESYRVIVHRTFDETFLSAAFAMALAAVLALGLGAGRGGRFEWAGEE